MIKDDPMFSSGLSTYKYMYIQIYHTYIHYVAQASFKPVSIPCLSYLGISLLPHLAKKGKL